MQNCLFPFPGPFEAGNDDILKGKGLLLHHILGPEKIRQSNPTIERSLFVPHIRGALQGRL